MWSSIIRLMITLSSSFLVLTMGLFEVIFPHLKGHLSESWYLPTSWIGFFLVIILGLCQEINELICHQNSVKGYSDIQKVILEKINSGELESDLEMEFGYTNNPFGFGFFAIQFFILSTSLLSISLIEHFMSRDVIYYVLALVVTLQGVLGLYFLKIRRS